MQTFFTPALGFKEISVFSFETYQKNLIFLNQEDLN